MLSVHKMEVLLRDLYDKVKDARKLRALQLELLRAGYCPRCGGHSVDHIREDRWWPSEIVHYYSCTDCGYKDEETDYSLF